MFWNTPNMLSLGRVILGPICIYLLMQESLLGYFLVLVLMTIGEVSDAMDGHLARRLGQVTDAGKIIDPMSDSLYRQIIFIGFHAMGLLPTWMMIILFSRDIIVSYLRIMAEQSGVTLSARRSGKIKAIAQGFAQIGSVVLLIAVSLGLFVSLDWVIWAFFLMATAVTLYSLIDYARAVITIYNQATPKEGSEG